MDNKKPLKIILDSDISDLLSNINEINTLPMQDREALEISNLFINFNNKLSKIIFDYHNTP